MGGHESSDMGTVIMGKPTPEIYDAVRVAVKEALDQFLTDHRVSAPKKVPCDEAEIRHLVRQCDQLSVIRSQLEARAGKRRRYRQRWRVEISTITRLISVNLERLQQLGVTPMAWPDRVEYALHEPVHVYPTGDPSQDGRVVDVVRLGFMRDGRPLRLMQVDVMTYRPAPQSATLTEKETTV